MSGFAPPSEYYASEIYDCTEARGGSTIIEVSNKTLLSSTWQDLIAPFTHLVISLLAVNLVAVRWYIFHFSYFRSILFYQFGRWMVWWLSSVVSIANKHTLTMLLYSTVSMGSGWRQNKKVWPMFVLRESFKSTRIVHLTIFSFVLIEFWSLWLSAMVGSWFLETFHYYYSFPTIFTRSQLLSIILSHSQLFSCIFNYYKLSKVIFRLLVVDMQLLAMGNIFYSTVALISRRK